MERMLMQSFLGQLLDNIMLLIPVQISFSQKLFQRFHRNGE